MPKTLIKVGVFTASLVLGFVFGFVVVVMAQAHAQEATPVVGTVDFRSPPQLFDGVYEDSLVVGETVWYTVMVRNSKPYRFEVTLPEGAADEAVTVGLVRPSLAPVGKRAAVLEGPGLNYDASHTNLWYLTVELGPTATPDVAYRVLLHVQGVEPTTLDDCPTSPTCTLDQELADLVSEMAAVEAELGEYADVQTTSLVELEIENLRGFLTVEEEQRRSLEMRLASAETTLAELCAPEPTCDAPDQGSSTPRWATGIGVLMLGGGVAVGAKRARQSDEDDEPDDVGYRPSALAAKK